MLLMWIILGLPARAWWVLQHRRSHSRTLCMRPCRLWRTETFSPRCHHRNTFQTTRSLHYRCCPRTQRGSGCVASSNAAAARGDAARKQHLIVKSRIAGIKNPDLRGQGVSRTHQHEQDGFSPVSQTELSATGPGLPPLHGGYGDDDADTSFNLSYNFELSNRSHKDNAMVDQKIKDIGHWKCESVGDSTGSTW